MVALSYLSVNTERYPPEAQDAVAGLIGVLPRIRNAYQRDVEDAVPYRAGA